MDNTNDDIMRIGIMGGTFDPIHYGHLVLAEQIRCEYKLDKIIFVPAGKPPHKENSKISDNMHRYFMTLIATINNPNFEVSDIEMKNPEISYTVNTIQKLNEDYDKKAKLFFITGADALLNIDTWKNVRELLNSCYIIAGTRPGHATQEIEEKIEYLKEKFDAKIRLVKVPALAISSTDIRNRIKNNQSIKYILPQSIELYIYKNSLYKK